MLPDLQLKIKTLNELMWDRRIHWTDVERWLDQFALPPGAGNCERTHALFLLGHFTYFNAHLMRALLRSLYRDQVQYPLVTRLRRRHKNTLDVAAVDAAFQRELQAVRFVGVGNPSESGTHLLYYFRQENSLPKELFVHPHELFRGKAGSQRLVPGIKHLVFLDDFCGSGRQATRYSKDLLPQIRMASATVKLSYHPLFATTTGLAKVRAKTRFDRVETVCELDESFQALEIGSRYFRESHDGIDRTFAAKMCSEYGGRIEPNNPRGFGDCQLLLGFAHNIPNNTLPIFWSEGPHGFQWTPIFRRYTKGVGW